MAIADPPVSVTVETILDDTRPADPGDYRTWGDRAAAVLSEYPDLARSELRTAMRAKARKRVTGEAHRTADGVARMLADAETGQASMWPDWSDADKVRRVADQIMAEGVKKLGLGRRMRQAADAMDLHPGLSAHDSWVAEGNDAADLDEAADAEEAVS